MTRPRRKPATVNPAVELERFLSAKRAILAQHGYTEQAWSGIRRPDRQKMIAEWLSRQQTVNTGKRMRRMYMGRELPPTEAHNHGVYEVRQVETRGKKAAVNRTPSPLRHLEKVGAITSRQREAGEVFEALYRFVWSASRADVLAQMITVGIVAKGSYTWMDGSIDGEKRARDLLRKAEIKMGTDCYVRVSSVCVDHLFIGDRRKCRRAYELLTEGLDIFGDEVGLPEEKS